MAQQKTKKQQTWLESIIEFTVLLTIVFLIRTFVFGLYQVPTGSMETTMLVGERFFADKFTYNFRKPRHGEIIAFNDPSFQYSDNAFVNFLQHYIWIPYLIESPANWTKRVIGVPGDTIRGTIEDGRPVLYRKGKDDVEFIKLDEPYTNRYPLIHVYKQDPIALQQQIEQEIQDLARTYRIDQNAANRYVHQRLAQETTWRSYDSSAAYDKQPFYNINPDRIITNEEGNPNLLIPDTPVEARPGKKVSPDVFEVKLGEKQYWGMGDNRLGSHDSRFFGAVEEKEIHGRILFRIWSMDSDEAWWIVDLIKNPINFWKRIRWSRFFQMIY